MNVLTWCFKLSKAECCEMCDERFSSGPIMKCSGCASIYHPQCAGVSTQIYENLTQEALDSWVCCACEHVKYRNDQEVKFNKDIEVYREAVVKINQENAKLRDDLGGLNKSLTELVTALKEMHELTITALVKQQQLLEDIERGGRKKIETHKTTEAVSEDGPSVAFSDKPAGVDFGGTDEDPAGLPVTLSGGDSAEGKETACVIPEKNRSVIDV